MDLKELADLSTGFTGADLNAVLTQARLAALEEAIDAASLVRKHFIKRKNLKMFSLFFKGKWLGK